ncbi:MAG: fasciclin domain-containing protein [Pseudomonadota bacterium]
MRTILATAATALVLLGHTTAANAQTDIVATAASAGDFGTLLAAAEAAGLVDTLQSPGPFTIFAPNDAAFAALPEGTVEDLLLPENRDQLVEILTYHVVPAEVFAEDIVGSRLQVLTVQGGRLAVNGTGGGVSVNDATVIAADVDATNGVIHVIDQVLLP